MQPNLILSGMTRQSVTFRLYTLRIGIYTSLKKKDNNRDTSFYVN